MLGLGWACLAYGVICLVISLLVPPPDPTRPLPTDRRHWGLGWNSFAMVGASLQRRRMAKIGLGCIGVGSALISLAVLA